MGRSLKTSAHFIYWSIFILTVIVLFLFNKSDLYPLTVKRIVFRVQGFFNIIRSPPCFIWARGENLS